MASKKSEIPKHEIDTLAKIFLPEIVAFFDTEDGKKEFVEWKQQKENTVSKMKGLEQKNSLPF